MLQKSVCDGNLHCSVSLASYTVGVNIILVSLKSDTCVFLNPAVLVIIHPEVKNWIKYAKFEEKNNYVKNARRIYERGIEYFGDENMDEKLVIAFAKFEEGQKEVSKK